ncbi:MAG: rhodanese-like domain-containing protein, partial [Bacteroidota bacterium]|nr:rhodanese-like domain-containing protein [Bacteroidota bacterium]
YENRESSTIGIEKKTNPFLAPRTLEQYREFVSEFFPPLADSDGGKMILQCGVQRVTTTNEGFTDITPEQLRKMMATRNDLVLIDVREPRELRMFGAIKGVINIPVGTLVRGGADLEPFKDKAIVALCQTGSRSVEASHYLIKKGFKNVYNLLGGTMAYLRSEPLAV